MKRASVDFAEANPLALAFGTLVAGVGVGLLFVELARRRAAQASARARIRGAVGDARRAAEDVGDVAKETMRDVGRAVGDVDLR